MPTAEENLHNEAESKISNTPKLTAKAPKNLVLQRDAAEVPHEHSRDELSGVLPLDGGGRVEALRAAAEGDVLPLLNFR